MQRSPEERARPVWSPQAKEREDNYYGTLRCEVRDLGRMAYKPCWEYQQGLFDALLARKRAGAAAAPDLPEAGYLLLVEHPAVYTLGKSGRSSNILVGETFLRERGAECYRIDRGGDVTFHGPGQLVVYPILDLERLGIGLRRYVAVLEEAVIRTVAEYGIAAGRIAGASGVWILDEGAAPRKICAVGVRSSRFVTMHGFALNVTTDLGWFSYINPCGFSDRGVTSIECETGRKAGMREVKELIVKFLSENLNVEIYKN